VNWVDLTLFGVLALFGLRGFFRGFFREFFSLAGLAAGFTIAVAYDQNLAAFVSKHWQTSPLLLKGVSFVVIFFVGYFLLSLAGWLLHRSEKLLFLTALNRTGGVALGIGKGAVVIALAIFALHSTALLPSPARDDFTGSYLVEPLSRIGQGLVHFGKEKIFAGEAPQPVSSSEAARL
jgi:membrane protein required for colicin V production